MEAAVVNPMWGATHGANSSFASIAGEGDFDLLVDYDLVSAPPGQSHLVIGVRDPGVVQDLQTFEVEREFMSDGTSFYATMLGGVPSNMVATTATHGTLRLKRDQLTYTSYGDGALVSTLIAQKAPRVAVTATLNDCALNDGGMTTGGYQPRFHNLRLASGTLANLPN
jgi:hypothetical protein